VISTEHLLEAHDDPEMCRSSQRVIEFVGQRWVSVVLIAGYVGARRFSEYRRFAVGISDRLLTLRLRQLEERGLLERTVIPTMPVQITYEPTESGRALVEALGPLFSWGVEQRV
jgi:DNA-binding HxlR family transcriptional regulator